jgi:hypothetical protein
MLPADLLSIIERLFSAEVAERRKAISERVQATKGQMAQRGQLVSGLTVDQFKRLFEEELRGLSSRLLNILKRVFEERRYVPELGSADAIQGELIHLLDPVVVELATRLARELSDLSLGGGDLAVQIEYVNVKAVLSVEVELLVESRAAGVIQPKRPSLWDRYGKEIVVGLVVTVLGALIVAALL